jgi:hypothetical protein
MSHPTDIDKYDGTLEQLANDITNLRYDSLAQLLDHIADNLEHDSKADFVRGRKQLSDRLGQAASMLHTAKCRIDIAYKICKPYMTETVKEPEKPNAEPPQSTSRRPITSKKQHELEMDYHGTYTEE